MNIFIYFSLILFISKVYFKKIYFIKNFYFYLIILNNFFQNPLLMELLSKFKTLLLEKRYNELDDALNSVLNRTTNINVFKIYLNFVKETNPSKLQQAYTFTIQKLWFHYDIYEIIKEYNLLEEDFSKKLFAYKIGLSNPIKDLNLLYQDLSNEIENDNFSDEINELKNSYKNSLNLLIKLEPLLQNESENFTKIIHLERKDRKNKIIKYFLEKYPNFEEIYFIYAESCKNVLKLKKKLIKGILLTNSVALKAYYSLYFKSTRFLDLHHEKLALIYYNLKRNYKNVDLSLSNSLLKMNFILKRDDNLFQRALGVIPYSVLDVFLTFNEIKDSQEIFLEFKNCNNNLRKKMAFTEFNLGNFNGIRSIYKKEMYNLLKEFLFIKDFKLWDNIFLKNESIFNKLNCDDAIEIIRNISFK